MSTRLNFARMTTTTGGTGTLVLMPVAGRPTFNQGLGVSSGTYPAFKYTVVQQVNGAYEIGTATYTANVSSPSISNRTVIESWDGSGNVGNSVINFGTSGVYVYCGASHQDILNADDDNVPDAGIALSFSTPVATEFVMAYDGIIEMSSHKNVTGSLNFTVSLNEAAITGLTNVAASSSWSNTAPSSNVVFSKGDVLGVSFPSTSGAESFYLTLHTKKTF